MALRAVILKYEMIPEARVFGIVGKFWLFSVGAVLQGLLLTAASTLLVLALRALERRVSAGQDTWKLGSLAAASRSLRAALVRWCWTHFMQLWAGG